MITNTELGIIVNSLGYIGLHEEKITNLIKHYRANQTEETENQIKDEIRKMKRLLNTLFTRNTVTAENRGYTDQELADMNIKLD